MLLEKTAKSDEFRFQPIEPLFDPVAHACRPQSRVRTLEHAFGTISGRCDSDPVYGREPDEAVIDPESDRTTHR